MPGGASTTLPAGTYNLVVDYDTGASSQRSPLSNVAIYDATPAGSPASTPTPVTLSLDISGSGAACTSGAASGAVGQWLSLPAAADCTQPGKPDTRLLGWSTSPTFPVAIAQRQIDQQWGAYELTDGVGAVIAVFIPAGGATFVTGSNTLYPVWSA